MLMLIIAAIQNPFYENLLTHIAGPAPKNAIGTVRNSRPRYLTMESDVRNGSYFNIKIELMVVFNIIWNLFISIYETKEFLLGAKHAQPNIAFNLLTLTFDQPIEYNRKYLLQIPPVLPAIFVPTRLLPQQQVYLQNLVQKEYKHNQLLNTSIVQEFDSLKLIWLLFSHDISRAQVQERTAGPIRGPATTIILICYLRCYSRDRTRGLEIHLEFCYSIISRFMPHQSQSLQMTALIHNCDIGRAAKYPHIKFLLSLGGDKDIEAGYDIQKSFIESESLKPHDLMLSLTVLPKCKCFSPNEATIQLPYILYLNQGLQRAIKRDKLCEVLRRGERMPPLNYASNHRGILKRGIVSRVTSSRDGTQSGRLPGQSYNTGATVSRVGGFLKVENAKHLNIEMENKELNVTVQELITPVPAALGSGNAGFQSSISSYRKNSTPVANLAGADGNATGYSFDMEIENPFKANSGLQRTPPMVQKQNTPKVPTEPSDIQQSLAISQDKPKVAAEPSVEVIYQTSSSKSFEELGRLITKLMEYVRKKNNVHHAIKHQIRVIKRRYNDTKEDMILEENKQIKESNHQSAQKGPKMVAVPSDLKRSREQADSPTNRESTNQSTQTSPNLMAKQTTLTRSEDHLDSSAKTQRTKRSGQVNQTPKKARESRKEAIVKSANYEEENDNWKRVKRKRPRKKPIKSDAMFISAKGETTYADILRRIKSDPTLQDFGENVSRIRRTQKGDLLLEIKATSKEAVGIFQEQVKRSIGSQAEIRTHERKICVECRDIDEVTTKEEICTALINQFGAEDINEANIKSLRKGFRDTQTAIINLPIDVAKKVLKAGKVRIGWVICRIREQLYPKKCYRCLEFGHIASNSTNKQDRSNMCRRCGETGHIAKNCSKKPECMFCKELKYEDVIHLNLNHCKATQDLLSQIICETCVDVAIVCEQYKNIQGSTWVSDSSGKAAIWACGNRAIEETSQQPENGFVRAKVGGIFVYSCYARPSATNDEYKQMLDNLIKDAMNHNPKIIAGDFNAREVELQTQEAVSYSKRGNKPTFMARGLCSIIDLTFMSTPLARHVEWSVSDRYTHSDHMAIIFSLNNDDRKRRNRNNNCKYVGWASKHLDKEVFAMVFSEETEIHGTAVDKANQITEKLKRACDAAMPKRRIMESRQSNYWWNQEIGKLRTICLRTRRRAQRARRNGNFEELSREYKKARHDFQHAIIQSKRKCFKEICKEADTDPWGKAYRVVTSSLKGKKSPQPTCPQLLEKIVGTLFPQHQQREHIDIEGRTENIPPISEEEIVQIAKGIGDKKAPGPDNIPNSALKLAVMKSPSVFINTFDQCLQEGIFPDQWKKQTLVLIPKPNKPAGEPASYRPICLLDTVGKILEKLIYNRLLPIVEMSGGLSNRQFGFRKAKSTIDAIYMVKEIAQKAIRGKGAFFGHSVATKMQTHIHCLLPLFWALPSGRETTALRRRIMHQNSIRCSGSRPLGESGKFRDCSSK
ncbi:Retrovirus-related Pol polyprotein from type-1 retrotransposable element R1 [Lucilia cuprina]|nr:Retrovirus-related Pol polyprotein from type-1 retrotransposable element R1 [Lucilia cuprina]